MVMGKPKWSAGFRSGGDSSGRASGYPMVLLRSAVSKLRDLGVSEPNGCLSLNLVLLEAS